MAAARAGAPADATTATAGAARCGGTAVAGARAVETPQCVRRSGMASCTRGGAVHPGGQPGQQLAVAGDGERLVRVSARARARARARAAIPARALTLARAGDDAAARRGAARSPRHRRPDRRGTLATLQALRAQRRRPRPTPATPADAGPATAACGGAAVRIRTCRTSPWARRTGPGGRTAHRWPAIIRTASTFAGRLDGRRPAPSSRGMS